MWRCVVDALFVAIWPLVRKRVLAETITIDGKTYSLAQVEAAIAAVPQIKANAAAGMGVTELIASIEPAAIPIIEALSNLFFPGLGTIESVVLSIIKASRPMTQEETNAWMDRATAGLSNR